MDLLSPDPDGEFCTQDPGETEDDSVELDHMPINVTTINVPADASGTSSSPCCKGSDVALLMRWTVTYSGSFRCYCGLVKAA